MVFRRLAKVVVKGRAECVVLHEPVALRGDATDQLRECIALFETGLARYEEDDWAGAVQYFEQSARLERDPPGNKANPSMVYLKLAQEYQANPGTGPTFG